MHHEAPRVTALIIASLVIQGGTPTRAKERRAGRTSCRLSSRRYVPRFELGYITVAKSMSFVAIQMAKDEFGIELQDDVFFG